MSLVTIIIPCYNIEAYLDRCLESVAQQSYKEFSVILIDDGSTDDTFTKCVEWKNKDNRVTLVSKKNLGLGMTRNLGIKMSDSEYITFLDADDWWHEDYLKEMIAGTENGRNDIVLCDFDFIYEEDNGSMTHSLSELRFPAGRIDINNEMFFLSRARTYAWGKLYRRSLFTDNSIEEPSHDYEDVATTPLIMAKAAKVYHVPKSMYRYVRNRPGSIINNFSSLYDLLLSLTELVEHFKAHKLFTRFYVQLRQMLWGELCYLYRAVESRFIHHDEIEKQKVKQKGKEVILSCFPELENFIHLKYYVGEDELLRHAIDNIILDKKQIVQNHDKNIDVFVALQNEKNIELNVKNKIIVSVDDNNLSKEHIVWNLSDEIFQKSCVVNNM